MVINQTEAITPLSAYVDLCFVGLKSQGIVIDTNNRSTRAGLVESTPVYLIGELVASNIPQLLPVMHVGTLFGGVPIALK